MAVADISEIPEGFSGVLGAESKIETGFDQLIFFNAQGAERRTQYALYGHLAVGLHFIPYAHNDPLAYR